MAYPGDFVAANRAARTDAQRAAIRRVSDLRRACFRVREWLAKRIPLGIYSHRTGFTRDSERGSGWLNKPRENAVAMTTSAGPGMVPRG
jgi:hypothetical protein